MHDQQNGKWQTNDGHLACGRFESLTCFEIEITKFILFLAKKYGDNITVNRTKVHDYLVMELDYSDKGSVKISMMKHMDKVFTNLPEEIGRSSLSPASDHLFVKVHDPEETEKLGKFVSAERVKDFHHTVAQQLFISGRGRRDIQTTVAFLMSRVKKPDDDDWGN